MGKKSGVTKILGAIVIVVLAILTGKNNGKK